MPKLKLENFKEIYSNFEAPISRYDCGKECAPHNNGIPICCSTDHAIPVAFYPEWQLLKSRTDLWHLYKAETAQEKKIKDDLPASNRLVECKGVQFCERENRSISCRTFPFYPYLTRENEFIGLAYYWNFEDRCWVISNLHIVEKQFIDEFVRAYEILFEHDPDERQTFRDYSTSMRRVFSRWKRTIPLVHRNGNFYKISPKTGGMKRVDPATFPKHEPYKNEA